MLSCCPDLPEDVDPRDPADAVIREHEVAARHWGTRSVHGLRTLHETVSSPQGAALPLALMTLAILAALTLGFGTLAVDSVSARNHLASAQARAFAEAGIERAVWGLSNPTAAGGVTAAAAVYDGATFVPVTPEGGFTVQVSPGARDNERNVTAVGWTPDATTPRAVRKIQVVAETLALTTITPPCALCVAGNLEVGGNANVDARANHCGTPPAGGSMTQGTTDVSGNGKIWGPGNDTANEDADHPSGVPASAFSFQFTDEDLDLARRVAKARGTYFQGTQSFNASNPLPDGIVFVDTTTGDPFTASTPDAEAASVQISGASGWRGWLIVAGSIQVTGNTSLTGLVYALNDLGMYGNVDISGAVVTENRKDTSATIVDAQVSGTVAVTYHCANAQTAAGTIPTGYMLKPGTYVEVAGR